jgi:uncharacterized oligopeptide transporter (OPT) family protein
MRRELTWQAVLSAIIVAALVSASYPYVILKLGIGPNISVVSAFLGAVLLLLFSPRTRGSNRLMNNIVQTAGTSAAMTAFMCVIAAAVDLTALNKNAESQMKGIHPIEPWPMFCWLTCGGAIGVLFMVLFRRHFLEDPKMVFADGVAAAEAIAVLDTRGREASDKLRVLGVCAAASALLKLLRAQLKWKDYFFAARLQVGIEWSLMSVGTGLLVGIAVSLSMLAGSCIVAVAGQHLIDQGIDRAILRNQAAPGAWPRLEKLIDQDWKKLTKEEQQFVTKQGSKQAAAHMQGNYFPTMLLWFMWPATGLMIASALTAVLLKWRSIVASFVQLRLRAREGNREDVSLKTVLIGTVLFAVALALVQEHNFGMSYLQTAVAVLCALPLILVGVRVLGETNFGPISIMMNGLQAIFAVFWPASIGHNLIAAGTAGTCNAQGEGTIQDYKTGQLIGSTPRVLTWVQFAAVPIGAAAVALMYPLLMKSYDLGTDALPAPTGVKISSMAVFLSQGFDALPEGALLWTAIASTAGVLIVLAQHFLRIGWLPSATGLGLGLLLPGTSIIPIAIGGLVAWIWQKQHPASWERYGVTAASGLIAGEAILGGLVLPAAEWIQEAGEP